MGKKELLEVLTRDEEGRAQIMYWDPDGNGGWRLLLKKHYDKLITEVAREDPSYLEWMMDEYEHGNMDLTLDQVMVLRSFVKNDIGKDMFDVQGDCD